MAAVLGTYKTDLHVIELQFTIYNLVSYLISQSVSQSEADWRKENFVAAVAHSKLSIPVDSWFFKNATDTEVLNPLLK
jgi:hypothetical protein